MDGDSSADGWLDGCCALSVVLSERPMRRRPQLRRRIVRMPRVSWRVMVCIDFESSPAAGDDSVAAAPVSSSSFLSSDRASLFSVFPSCDGKAAGISFLLSQYNSHILIANVARLRSIEDFKGEALARSWPAGEMSISVESGACKEWLSRRVSDSVINCICILSILEQV